MYAVFVVSGLFFFFSSRRRHTRFSRDWSSDVCSSDLGRRAGRGEHPDGAGGGVAVRQPAVAHATQPLAQRTRRTQPSVRTQSSRSEERRVGKECRSRRSPEQKRTKEDAVIGSEGADKS